MTLHTLTVAEQIVSKPFTDIDGKELELLIAQVTEAKKTELATHGTTIHKLQTLLAIKKSSEKLSDVTNNPKASKPRKRKTPKALMATIVWNA